MSLPTTLVETYLYQAARLVLAGELPLEKAIAQLTTAAEWGNPSDGEINRVDTLIQDLLRSQREPQFGYILAELNLAVCRAVGSPSQEVLCANTLGEAITGLKDARLIPRRIEVYESALEIAKDSGDEWRAAILYNNLGNAYSDLATGDPQANAQAAIDCFERALTVFTPETSPYAWATIQNNLATVYKVRPGNDDANIQPAIACWEQALTVFRRDTYPLEWANVQRNLGIACKDLNNGDPVTNLVRAKGHLLVALEVLTSEEQPTLWAEVQNTLGNVYFRLTTGDRSENLRQAITCFEAALTIRTERAYPVQFAATSVNLGNTWLSLPTGNRIENLRRAIDSYERALGVYSPQDFPELNAQVHANLAAAYLYLPAGDRAQNLRRAEQSLRIALGVYTRSNNPTRYAWVKSTQGAVYQAMARNNPDRIPQAIDCYRAALEVYTAEEYPADYARAMDTLGTLYRALPGADRQEHYRQAEHYYLAALTIYRRESYPDEFASTQTNLGNCYLFWPTSDRSQTILKAMACYHEALSIHTRDRFPLDHARLMDGLAAAYSSLANQREEFRTAAAQCFQEALDAAISIGAQDEIVRIAGNGGSWFWRQDDWASACLWLARALHTLEGRWEEHYSAIGRSELQEEHAALYARVVQSCYMLGRKADALQYVEHSRSRYLLSLLGETIKHLPSAPPPTREKVARLSELSEELRATESVTAFVLSPEQALDLIRQQESLRKERNDLLELLAHDLPEYVVALRLGQLQDFQSLKEMLRAG
jgi:tetratricopeptide (TPR) repeat protein